MAKKSKQKAMQRWEKYYSEDGLDRWQQMAIKKVYVNIRDFLEAVAGNEEVPRHTSFSKLLNYTHNNRRYYSLRKIAPGSPLAALLRELGR
ncbi:hypothetical protein SCUCBS95973_004495 [Sporothrix curviconia]|uniref:Uncharacterized protein n=1 Tax=Sporothrix curviconia TaxID=1260050 RepID=A0ABP0BP46_9PEZI